MRTRYRDAGERTVACRGALIDIGFGNEALGHQRFGARKISLCQPGIGLRLAHTGCQLDGLLGLHGIIDPREYLTPRNRLAGFHEHCRNPAAFALDADGGITSRCNRAWCRYHISNGGHAGDNDSNLGKRVYLGRLNRLGAECFPQAKRRRQDAQHDYQRQQPAATRRAGTMLRRKSIGACRVRLRQLVIHVHTRLDPRQATVLSEYVTKGNASYNAGLWRCEGNF